jgi:hypothetical protein
MEEYIFKDYGLKIKILNEFGYFISFFPKYCFLSLGKLKFNKLDIV